MKRTYTLMSIVAVLTLIALAATFTARAELLSYGFDQNDNTVLFFDSQPPELRLRCLPGEREAYRRKSRADRVGVFGCWKLAPVQTAVRKRSRWAVSVRWEDGTRSRVESSALVYCGRGSVAAYGCLPEDR